MKRRMIFALLLLMPGAIVLSKNNQQKFDKAAFYMVMDRGNLDEVSSEIDVVSALSLADKDGYTGALLMRKAGLVKRPAEKLKLFKAGRIKFDTAISADKDNVEFHFLRFAIQEHAPKIVKYHADLEADKKIIIRAYKNLSPVVQHAIMDYTRNSKLLRAQDLN
ncbi:hypothetical protein [Mucilaginibacter sp. UR6-11]|uniref:hypothetical protein n=1 Tax=Mucilaginibacter sp. UR6-11 TaxID=1435644 RepID=UPI001E28D52F|nr:hypothetical protein [Mucilaginibacter sp. UR6-11]MCC8425880.1 hypothetical protein [Mucilaginibacter sp. UR6-11]